MSAKDEVTIFQNREMSWLKFNERVLGEAVCEDVPLLEKLKFVSIFESNLDEFFMIRVGTLFDQTLVNASASDLKTGINLIEQLNKIFEYVDNLIPVKDKTYSQIEQSLSEVGIIKMDISKLAEPQLKQLERYFSNEILPLTSPLVIDNRHPFPFLRSQGIYVGVYLNSKSDKNDKNQKDKNDKSDKNQKKIGIIPVGTPLERIVFIPAEGKLIYVLLEEVILYFADRIFKKYKTTEKVMFRITRNADIDVDDALFDYDIDFRDAMSDIIKKRKRLAPVRLQIYKGASPDMIKYLVKKLKIGEHQVSIQKTPLDLSFVFPLISAIKQNPVFTPELVNSELAPVNILDYINFKQFYSHIKQKDTLIAYPFESTKPFINLLRNAADNPNVVSIKITLYRVAQHSRIIPILIKAAENGKEVIAVVELKARFDEENNISWSKQLEEAGATVIYGTPGLKVHSKLLLITEMNGREIEYLTQVGTGNYNEETSKLYTDLSLITTNKAIGSEASMVFNSLAIGELVENTEHLLVAPKCLKTKVIEMIDRETAIARSGGNAMITIKCNSVSDKDIIDKFIEASQAGVKIKLFVRGICCFLPGVAGFTDNITVKSIVGRLLEHSRLYIFGTKERAKVYISSADFMTRNTHSRVEVACPVYDTELQEVLYSMIDAIDKDNVKARLLTNTGEYVKIKGDCRFDSQVYFYEMFKNQVEDMCGKINATETAVQNRKMFVRITNLKNEVKLKKNILDIFKRKQNK